MGRLKQLENNNPLSKLYDRKKDFIWVEWRKNIQNIRSYSFFIHQLVRINFLSEFKRSFIGVLWLFLLPIFSIITWTLLNNAGIMQPGETEIPYPAYVLLSTSIWGFFIGIYKSTSKIFGGRGNMMIMVRFPHEVLLVEKLIVHLIRFVIPLFINLLVLFFLGIRFSALSILFPLTLLPLLMLGAGIGLIIALFRVVAVDVAKLFDQAMNFLMLVTPIIYAPKVAIGWLSTVVHLNPLTYLIGFSRDVLTKGTFYEPFIWSACAAFSFVFFLIALRIYMMAEPKLLERLISN